MYIIHYENITNICAETNEELVANACVRDCLKVGVSKVELHRMYTVQQLTQQTPTTAVLG